MNQRIIYSSLLYEEVTPGLYDPWFKTRRELFFPHHHIKVRWATMKINGAATWLTTLQSTFNICFSALSKPMGRHGCRRRDSYSPARSVRMRGAHCSRWCCSMRARCCEKWASEAALPEIPACSSQPTTEEQLFADTSPSLGWFCNTIFSMGNREYK